MKLECELMDGVKI